MTINVDLVKELIDEREWTWADLAREMGMAKSTIIRVKSYQTTPGTDFVFALERVFPDHDRDELFVPFPQVA
jgi:ribosome-binding protein aMBF1 (putative translation factor)